ncbi:transposase, partial [Corynebacterium striatum]
VFVEGHSITFELFGVPRHGGRLPFFPTQPGWISGVYQTGVTSLLGMQVATAESTASWTGFFRDLKARGLGDVYLVTSDAHLGIQ